MKSCRVDGAGNGGGGVTWFNTGVEDDGSVAFAIGGAPAAAEAAAKGSVAIVVVGAAAAAKALTVPARGSPAVGFVPPGGAISLSRQMRCRTVSTGFGVQWVGNRQI